MVAESPRQGAALGTINAGEQGSSAQGATIGSGADQDCSSTGGAALHLALPCPGAAAVTTGAHPIRHVLSAPGSQVIKGGRVAALKAAPPAPRQLPA